MFTDVMVDIETTGTSSFDHNAVLQIAGVKFNFETEDVSHDIFNASLAIPPGRFWDKDTEAWWKKQKPHILQNIIIASRPAQEVMKEYHTWLLRDYPMTDDGLRFWGKPTHFDYSFLASYLNQFGLQNPCHYRSARDLNSFMAGMSGSAETLNMERTVEFEGDQHNAIHDSLFQIKMLFAAKRRFTSMEVIGAN